MRVLLVHPLFPATYWGFEYSLPYIARKSTLPPLGLISLAALLPNHWSLQLIDMNVEELRDEHIRAVDVVFTGGMLIQTASIQDVIARARKFGRRVVVGGPGPTTSPELFADADVIFKGEAEGRIESLLAALDARNAGPRPQTILAAETDAKPDMTTVPVPRFDLLNLKAYKAMSVQYSRGCPFSCEFCDIIEIYGRVPRVKTAEQVLAEFDALYALGHRGTLFVVDDNFIGNKRSARKLLPRVIEWQKAHGSPFALFTEASVNLAADDALIKNMVEAGFTTVFLGLETPSEESLLATKKKQNVGIDLVEAIDKITRAGMEVMGGFIVGFDTDTPEIFATQRKFIASIPVPLAMIGVLIALPETGLFRRLAGEGRLRTDANGDAFGRPNFEPVLDEEFLVQEYGRLLEDLNSPEGYYARATMLVERIGKAGPNIPITVDDLLITARALVGVGVLSERRGHFWKLMQKAVKRPHAIRVAITHAIQAEHAIRYTQDHVMPKLRESLLQVRRDMLAKKSRSETATEFTPPPVAKPHRALPIVPSGA